jgi:hypothetical protein
MTKGLKTSELWVVVLMLLPYVLQQLGIDLGQVGLTDTQKQVAEIAAQLRASGADNQGAQWIALAYVVGRTLLKFKN